MDLSNNTTIAHYMHIDPWLPESFLTDQINHIQNFQQIVLTRGANKRELFKENVDLFVYGKKYLGNSIIKTIKDRAFFHYSLPFKKFSRIIEQYNIKLLHAHFSTDALEVLPLKRKFNLPMITSCYGYDVSSFPRNKLNRLRLIKLFKECDVFLVLSQDMKRDLLNLGCEENKVIIHHIGVNTEKFCPANDDSNMKKRIRFLSVGFLTEKKGFFVLIDALNKLFKKGFVDIDLVILGQGKLKEKIMQHINNLNLTNKVKIVKTTSKHDVIAEYRKADVFVLASHTASNGDKEGTPTVLLEAQAVGLPVISTFHAGIPEAVLDNKSGFLVPERDSEALAEKMENLIRCHDKWKTMGEFGREYVEKEFNISLQVRKLESIYNSLIEKYEKN